MDAGRRTATCALCGPTTIIGKGGGRWSCQISRDNSARGNGHGVKRSDMLKLKNGAVCDICGKGKNLAIDHDHRSGALRGLLCSDCNTSLGKLGDDIEGLERALRYLKNPPGVNLEDLG